MDKSFPVLWGRLVSVSGLGICVCVFVSFMAMRADFSLPIIRTGITDTERVITHNPTTKNNRIIGNKIRRCI